MSGSELLDQYNKACVVSYEAKLQTDLLKCHLATLGYTIYKKIATSEEKQDKYHYNFTVIQTNKNNFFMVDKNRDSRHTIEYEWLDMSDGQLEKVRKEREALYQEKEKAYLNRRKVELEAKIAKLGVS